MALPVTNFLLLQGNLLANPVTRTDRKGNPYTTFALVTNESTPDGQHRADLHDCVAFGPRAQIAATLRKGNAVTVQGSLRRLLLPNEIPERSTVEVARITVDPPRG